jgi:hypothetical protein
MLMSDKTDSTGLAGDAVIGAIGGKIGDMAIRGASQVLAPQLDSAVTNLANEGARLTPGRFFPTLKKSEDLARSYPIVGSKIDDAMSEAEASVSRIPLNRSLGNVGERLPDGVAAGHEATKFTGQKLGGMYDETLSGTFANLDPTFITRMNYLGQRSGLRPQEADVLNDILQREVGGTFLDGNGQMTGRNFKRLDSKLGKMATKLQASPDDPFKSQLGDSVEFIQEQMRHLYRRQNPSEAAVLRNLDKAWADYMPARRASSMALEDGIPTPGQYRSAVRQNDGSMGKGATARGEARLQDFASDASKVIPAERGNSGSADRLNLASLKAWGIGAGLSPLYSRPALNGLNYMATRNIDPFSKLVAEGLRSLPRGMFGGGLPLLIGSR